MASTTAMRGGFLLLLCLGVLGASAIAYAHDTGASSTDLTAGSELNVAARSLAAANDDDDDFGEVADADPGDTDVESKTISESRSGAAKFDGSSSRALEKKSDRKKEATFENKLIEFAPAATVEFGDDIDDEGACAKEIEKLCEDVDEGEGKLADCISDAISESENPGPDDEIVDISDACREEVYQYKISRNSNINKNIPLARACKADADKFCNVTWFFGYKAGQVMACLRDVEPQVTKRCKAQLFKIKKDAAVDFRADPFLYEACKDDAESLCKDVKNGGGRKQACLQDKRMQLSWACEEQLFRQEGENSDDIRLSVRLYNKCLPDKRKFCKNIEPGSARVKDCLEEAREQLSVGCREEVDAMIERRVRDFRLDSKLRNSCENEIYNMCAYFGDLDDIDTYDSSVINCLQDYSTEIKSDECKKQVKKYMTLAAQDIRFDVPLAEACYEDRQKYCGHVAAGSARVIRCLRNQRDSLSPVCRATLFDEEVRFSENIDFQYPMKEACKHEIEKFCKEVPHGNGQVIRCLQDRKYSKDFGKACRDEVQDFENEISKDYRLNYRLRTACQHDIKGLCASICAHNDGQVCGGKVLRCLTDKIDQVKADQCKKEIHYFEKMEVSNFKNDIILAEACRRDVDAYCANVEPGEGRVHKCLRDNRKKLSDACRKEELLLEEKEADSIELNTNLLKSCAAERSLFCKEVQPGGARVFRCLAENMNDPDFGNTCKYQIIYKLQRRQANWKLDPPLRRACRENVNEYCAAEDAKASEEGLVYKCLINTYEDLDIGCQKELGRAVHMAFFAWQPNAILTADCDDDIQRLCLAARPSMAQRPGAVGTCIASMLEADLRSGRRLQQSPATGPAQGLSEKCWVIADIAEPPNMKKAFESSLSVAALIEKLNTIDEKTGLPVVSRDRTGNPQGISLTGWVAMLGMFALVVLVVFGALTMVKKIKGVPDRDYTLVVKQHPGR